MQINCPEVINQIDWPLTLSVIRDVVISIATVLTAFVAVRGLNKWHTELTGKAAFDAARTLAKATYNLRDNLEECRAPVLRDSEFPAEYNSDTKKNVVSGYIYVYQKRWDRVQNALLEFDTHAIEGEALWGSAIRTKTDELRSCANDVYLAITDLLENHENNGGHFKADTEYGVRTRSTVHASFKDKSNLMNVRIDKAVHEIEVQLMKYLGRSSH